MASGDTTDWSKAAEDFDRITPFTMHFSKDSFDALEIPENLSPDLLVMDIAAGTGSFALLVANLVSGGVAGRILATDISPGMVEVLKAKCNTQLSPEKQILMDCRVMDGQNLEIPDDSVSHIGCVFGVMFYPDRLKGLREIYRVLRPGGKASLVVWKDVEFLNSLVQIAMNEGKVTEEQLPLPAQKVMLCYADEKVVKQDLSLAGFRESDIRVFAVTHEQEFPIDTIVQSFLSNPMFASFGLSRELLIKHLTSLEHPDRGFLKGTANIVVVTK